MASQSLISTVNGYENYIKDTEPNFEYAKEAFRNRAERRIADKLEEVEKLKAELKIINESEE